MYRLSFMKAPQDAFLAFGEKRKLEVAILSILELWFFVSSDARPLRRHSARRV